jgi:hypothetical protein
MTFQLKKVNNLYKNNLLFVGFAFLCQIQSSFSQVTLDANGPGNTYELITSVFAPGNGVSAVEAPDLYHPWAAGGNRHIAEVFDTDLFRNVFEFYSHALLDNEPVDPTLTDRQRVEIKTYAASPDNLKGTVGENIIYKWSFKLPVGFQPSSNFTHIHQIKAVDGDDGNPLFTLTPRLGNPNKLELIYVENSTSGTNKVCIVELLPFLGNWVDAEERIKVGSNGIYSIILKKHSDGTVLMSYTNTNIATIRPDNTFIRPKWGIYRSILDIGNLRDEAVRFSGFSIQEVATLNTNSNDIGENEINISNPINENLELSEIILKNYNKLQLFDISGKIILELNGLTNKIDLSNLNSGIYLIQLFNDDMKSKPIKIIKK